MIRKISWSVLSQVASSATNFVVSLFVARSVSLDDFGRFSLVFILAAVILQFGRSTLGHTLLLGADERPSYFRAQVVVGLFASAAVAILAAYVLSWWSALACGAATFVAFVYDGLRFSQMRQSQWRRIALSDSLVLVLVVVGSVYFSNHGYSTFAFILLWGAGGCVGVIALLRWVPLHSGNARQWIGGNRAVLGPLAAETGLFLSVGYGVNWMLAGLLGPYALGQYRASQVTMTPMGTLGQSATLLLVGGSIVADDVLRRSRRRIASVVLLGSSSLILITAGWTVALYLGVGTVLFSANWPSIASLVWVVALGQCAASVGLIASALVKRIRGAVAALRIRSWIFWIDPVAIGLGALAGDVQGAVVGLLVSQLCSAFAFLIALIGGRRTPAP